MATRAARKIRNKPVPAAVPDSSHKPQHWWQWFLIYPTFAIALVSAAPDWVDKVQAWTLGVSSASEAKKQALLWEKNQVCAGMPFKSFTNPDHIAVDATICDSGDVLMHAVTPQNAKFFKWIAVEDIVPAKRGGLIPAANAATVDGLLAGSAHPAQSPTLKLAQFQVNVLCQRMDGRFLHRRVATPQGCFQEVIDTFSGNMVARSPAPCVAQC